MGMYGMIIAKNYPDTTKLWTGGPGFNKEYSYLMTDMDTMMHETPLSPGDLHSFEANYCMINGYADWMMFARPNQIIDAAPGDSICLHLGNLGYSTTRLTFPPGSNPTVYESDARVLAQPFTCDTLRIYPGERFEVILRPTTAVTGWIEVDYLNAILDDSISTNYIGFNQYVHPTGVAAVPLLNFDFELFPNPTNHNFTIVSEQVQIMQIYTVEGRLVQSQLVSVGSNNIDCSGLSSGVYVVRLGTASKRLIIAAD